ncbi:MAG: hypothetical protein A2Y34_02465 [Spirochaetes bacterium GWC1_27_15]|nr:MAG: hypothetical protein A2Z98_15040 [Spirochaetes bacterium GWB1_27_13]OHD28230.1 MAG: hypothetical protein A2Y34_02465 [Spirochaetes bacterium GWC1_27_15]
MFNNKYFLVAFVFLILVCCNKKNNDEKEKLLMMYPDFNPKYSYDGEKLIFDIRYNYKSRIFEYNRDSQKLKVFTDKDNILENVFEPSYSIDSQFITFIKYFKSSGTREVFIMKSDGTDIVQLTYNNMLCYFPFFSNDSKKIFFGMKQKVKSMFKVYSVEINSKKVTLISNDEFINATSPGITNNDKYIIFSDIDLTALHEDIANKRDDSNNIDVDKIVKIDINDGSVSNILYGNNLKPNIVNDTIIFLGYNLIDRIYKNKLYKLFNLAVYKIDIDGNNMETLYDDKLDMKSFRVSKNGRYAFFESYNGHFYEIDLISKNKKEIVFDENYIIEQFNK